MPDDFDANVHRFLSQYNEFFRDLVETLYRDMLIEIKNRMREAGYNDKLIANVRLSEIHLDEQSGVVNLKIISDYTSSRIQADGKAHEFKVADGMEEGTEPHWIERRWAKMLRWIDKATGLHRFAIRTYNPGMGKGQHTSIKELGVVGKTHTELLPKMQKIVDKASRQFLFSTLRGQSLPPSLYERGELVS